MTLHLIKLCVGAESIEDLDEWIASRLAERRAAGLRPRHAHVTRMAPQRRDELLVGGSLYWVIRGQIQVRQRLLAIEPFTDEEGIGRCRLVLETKPVPTEWWPKRPFQGWRYLDGASAPPDIGAAGSGELPPHIKAELAYLGVR